MLEQALSYFTLFVLILIEHIGVVAASDVNTGSDAEVT